MIDLLRRDAQQGGDLLEQLDAVEECEHLRMPWDPGPDCGCWGTVPARAPVQLRLMLTDTDDQAAERIKFLRDTYNTPGMSYRTTAIAFNALYGTRLTLVQVRHLVQDEIGTMRRGTLHSLGIAA
jgi:hypothetical protein